MNLKNIFRKKQKNLSKTKKMQSGLTEEIANIKTVAQMYSFAKKVLNPDEILQKTGNRISIFAKLENDGQVATCIDSRNAGITGLKYRLNYSDEKYKDFFDNLVKSIDIHGLIEDILKAPLYGFQPIEIMWGQDEQGYVIPEKFEAKPQEWFFFNNDRELCFDKKGCSGGYIISEDQMKFLLPRHKADFKNPYGKSLLSRCFWDTVFKKGSIEFWMKFAEKYGMPFIYGKYTQGMSEEEINNLLNSLDAMVQDAVAVIPDNSSVEILDTGGKTNSAAIYQGIIDLCDRNIAKNILGQTLTTDNQGAGSYALGNVHLQVRQDIINSDKRLVEKWINKPLAWVSYINFGTTEFAPEIEFYSEQGVDKERADRDKVLSETGVKFTKKYFTKNYDLDEEDFEIATSDGTDIDESENFSEGRAKDEFTQEKQRQELLEKFMDNFSDADLEKYIEPKLRAVIKEFAQNKDAESAYDALSVLYPNEDSKSLEDTLAKAIFTAGLIARSHKDEDND